MGESCEHGAKDIIGVADFKSNSNEVHCLMAVVVLMVITGDNHWILYTTEYRAESTGTGSIVKNGAWVETLELQCCQRSGGGAASWSAGE